MIRESIRHIPIALAKLREGAPVDRVRLNRGTPFFTSQDQLSYITNEAVISSMTEFGRANKPHQPLFYGALESSMIKENRLTAYLETSTLLRDNASSLPDGELFTLSRWRTNKELIIPEIVFSDKAIAANPDTAAAFQKHFDWLKEEPMREIALQQLRLFSEEFARKTVTHHDYKIAVAYADLLMNEGGHPGVLYPSVQSGYQGQCIVLRPEVVDENLYLEAVSTHRIHKNLMQSVMANYFHTTTFGGGNSNFTWDLDECDEAAVVKHFSQCVLTKPQPKE